NRRVDNALRTELIDQSGKDLVYGAGFSDVFAADKHPGIAPHFFGERFADGFAERQFTSGNGSFKHKYPGRPYLARGMARRWQTGRLWSLQPRLRVAFGRIRSHRRVFARSSSRGELSTDRARFSTIVLLPSSGSSRA